MMREEYIPVKNNKFNSKTDFSIRHWCANSTSQQQQLINPNSRQVFTVPWDLIPQLYGSRTKASLLYLCELAVKTYPYTAFQAISVKTCEVCFFQNKYFLWSLILLFCFIILLQDERKQFSNTNLDRRLLCDLDTIVGSPTNSWDYHVREVYLASGMN